MLESSIEAQLRRRIKSEVRGALCLKFVSPGYTGVPDRLILLPNGRVVFAELKAPKKTERPRQRFVQSRLRKMGFIVFSSVDSREKVDAVVQFCRREAQDGV